MRGFGISLLVATVGLSSLLADDLVTLKPVKAEQLDRAIAAYQGKVVIVDFWATYCSPCKKEFPNLVAIHQQYAGRLAAISVSLDDEEDSGKALKFLQQQKATFENFHLLEPAEVYQKRYQFIAIPHILIYGTDGKLIRRFSSDDQEFTYKDVRAFLETLIK